MKKKSVLAVSLVSVCVLAAGVTSADTPTPPKILVAGRAAAAARFVPLVQPVPISPAGPLSAAQRATVLAALPKGSPPTPAQSFAVGPTLQPVPAQNGQTPSVWLLRPDMATRTATFFTDSESSSLSIQNIPPGSWFVDCTYGALDTAAPFRVLFSDGSPNPNSDMVTPAGEHLVLGLVVKTSGRIQVSRTKAWGWTGCKFEAI